MEQVQIERLNELTALAKQRPLSELEALERQALRQEYLDSIRSSLTSQLDNTYILSEDGTKTKLKKKEEN